MTAVADTNGPCALFEFTGALPRAKLYSNWQVSTNDQATLQRLADPSFVPAQTVLVANALAPANPAGVTNQSAGSVEITSYAPKHLHLHANAPAASVLLLNDHFDPNWKVWVDGKPETLLRCNYIMQGVQVPAGAHDIELRFAPPLAGLYVSLAAWAVGLLLGVCTVVPPRRVKAGPEPISAAPVKKAEKV